MTFVTTKGKSPLRYVSIRNDKDDYDLLSLFLEYGSNPNIPNFLCQIPIHLLLYNIELQTLEFYQELVDLMLYHGGDINAVSHSGCTSLHLEMYHQGDKFPYDY